MALLGFRAGSAEFPRWSAEFPRWSAEFPRWPAEFPRWPAEFPRWPAEFPRWPAEFPRWSAGFPRWPAEFPRELVFCMFFVFFVWSWCILTSQVEVFVFHQAKKGGLYFTAVRHKPTRSREHKPPTHITTGTPRQKQAGIGEYRPPHNRSSTKRQCRHRSDARRGGGGGANEAAGGCPTRNERARLERGVRGCCKSAVLPDRPARCVAVSCHVVGFVFGCGQFSSFEGSVAVGWGVGMAIWQGAAPKSAQTRDRAPTGNRENDGIVVSSRAGSLSITQIRNYRREQRIVLGVRP